MPGRGGTRARGQAWGSLLLRGLRKTLSILPSASGSLSLGSHSYSGYNTVHETKYLRDTMLSIDNRVKQ